MLSKKEQIELKQNKPIEIGDTIRVDIPYVETETTKVKVGRKNVEEKKEINKTFTISGKITKINGEYITFSDNNSTRIPRIDENILKYTYEQYNRIITVHKQYVSPTFSECGANPFVKERKSVNFYNQELISILWRCGVDRYGNEKDSDGTNRVNFEPFVIDKQGNRQHYQRGLVWTLEQKQLLIDSIYNDIEIGKFLFRYNSWKRMNETKKDYEPLYSWDLVDGKQRLTTIIQFVKNKFPDSYGNYWDDLSLQAQNRLLQYRNLSYGELGEDANDQDVLDSFLTLNHTGVPMSKEHIEFVRSISNKL